MKKKLFLFFAFISTLFLLVGCKSKKNKSTTTTGEQGGTARIKDLNKYDGIGVYNNAKNSSANNEIRMIKVIDDEETKTIDLRLCGLIGNKQNDLSYSGYDPFKDKTILGCKFMKNFIFVLSGTDTITVSNAEYDEKIWQLTHCNLLKKQGDSNNLYIISFSTGNVYDVTEYFGSIEIKSDYWEGSSNLVFYASKSSLNQNGNYYLLEEVDDDIVVKNLKKIDFLFMDRYDTLYFDGGYYLKKGDTSENYQRVSNAGYVHIGLSLTGECFYWDYNDIQYILEDYRSLWAMNNLFLSKDIEVERYSFVESSDANFAFGYYDENVVAQSSDKTTFKERLWELTSCFVSYQNCKDGNYLLEDDNLILEIGSFNVIYDETNPLRYKLYTNTCVLTKEKYPDRKWSCSNSKATVYVGTYLVDQATSKWRPCLYVVDSQSLNKTVENLKNETEPISDTDIQHYEKREYAKIVDLELDIEYLEIRDYGDGPIISFKGYRENETTGMEYLYGYIDENYNLVFSNYQKGNNTIVIHKLG